MSDAELAACRGLLDRLSIVPEARLAAGFAGVRAMHDVTEGGLATALRELASAAGRRDTVHVERVPVLPEAARLCELLGADPLGLIGSGSLLVCCGPARGGRRCWRGSREAGIAAADIGEFGGAGGVARGRPRWSEQRSRRLGRQVRRRTRRPRLGRRRHALGRAARPGRVRRRRGGGDPRGTAWTPRTRLERRELPVDVELVAEPPQGLAQLGKGRRSGTDTTSSISNSGALVYGAGRSEVSTLSMLTPSSPSR